MITDAEGSTARTRPAGAAGPKRGSWRKSRLCGANTGCLEVRSLGAGSTGVRDSVLDESSPVIVLDRAALAGFLGHIKAGRLDLK
ncbi:DUF397 domain-containing protein [Actinomadura sp. NAK00032]|uniref:DUF397 domain-containing protein n=1 Tax=Actinomadura sp. NAK00032 TaxID=2742128 RepID=UPI0015926B28|nr:DUF397 domain-containing protein [Actinomadura sp. NAK00032]QKW33415.1 DUF397 domain-containing protein [Actinomadura sp. NAK00032]